jgi:hypothetical protein
MIKKLLFLPELGKSIIISDEKFSLKIVPHETGDSQLLILEYIPSKDVIEIGSFSSYDEALDKIKYMTQIIIDTTPHK